MSLLPLALLFAATMLIGNIRDISISLFLAVQKARLEFVVYVVETIGIVVGYVVIFRAAPTALSLFFVYAFATLVSAVCAFLFGSGIARFRSGRFTWVLGKQILRNGLPLSLFGIATYLFFSADQLIVEYYHGLREVGIYNVGTRIVLAVAVVPGLLNSVVLPHLSRHREDPVKIKKIILYCLGLLVGGASLFSCGIFLLGPWIIQRFFSVEFWPIIPLLGPLSLMTVPLFAVSLFDYVLISYNLQKQDFYLTLAAGVVNVALNFGLVPRYGIAGAVGASVASQFINAFLTCGYMVRVLNRAARPVSAPNF
jgi:O-antigen/teichoic acid export membrane protein